jgi:hypothetical protein
MRRGSQRPVRLNRSNLCRRVALFRLKPGRPAVSCSACLPSPIPVIPSVLGQPPARECLRRSAAPVRLSSPVDTLPSVVALRTCGAARRPLCAVACASCGVRSNISKLVVGIARRTCIFRCAVAVNRSIATRPPRSCHVSV